MKELVLLMAFSIPTIGAAWQSIGRMVGIPQPAAIASYDAVSSTGKRKSPSVDRRSEDSILNTASRSKLQASSNDLHRNYALAAWALRRHLDYVASFGFQCQSPDKEFNSEVERLMEDWGTRADIAGRHRIGKLIRLNEARATLDGDAGWLLIDQEDGRLQGIESDRIRNPDDATAGKSGNWVHGVRVDKAGKALGYALHSRVENGFAFERVIPAQNLVMRGYFDRYDQVRGISPLAAAVNTLRDTYENIDYALAKAKISQLLGFKVTRDGTGQFAPTAEEGDGYKIDFGRGPVFLDMNPGEDASFLNANTPTNEFQQFMQAAIMLSLKALDIPYSFFDESHTNFFGSRGAWLHYERAARNKREDNQACLDRVTRWLFTLWIRDGKLPSSVDPSRKFWSWIPRGMPWWKPTEEIAGTLAAIGAGLDHPQRACEEADRGDVFENIDKTAEVMKYAQEKLGPYGMALSFMPQPITAQPLEQPPGKVKV